MRADDINREHKRQALNEIREWAKAGYELFYDYQQATKGKISHSPDFEKILTNLAAEMKAMTIAAEQFDDEFKGTIELAIESLEDYWHNNDKWDGIKRKEFQNRLEVCFAAVINRVATKRAELKI